MKYFCFKKDFWHYACPSIFAFSLTAFYLIYLSLVVQAIIVNDSICYVDLGKLLYQHGLAGYLKDTVQREPMYPYLISSAMHLADWSGLPFEQIQKWIQVVFLMITQVLVFILLKKMEVRRWFTAAVIFALGTTPTLVNSVFWTFSEIVTYPFIVLLILMCGFAWQRLKKNGQLDPGSAALAMGMGLCCVILTLTKDAFELIVPVILGIFILGALRGFLCQEKRLSCALLLFVFISGIFYYGPVTGYKWFNWKQNGSFVLTNRGPLFLYGYTLRRMAPMDRPKLLSLMAFVPGEEFCDKVLGYEQCSWWTTAQGDKLTFQYLRAMPDQQFKEENIDHQAMALSFKKIFGNPLQFFSLMYIESFKALFWTNDYSFQVAYPDWIDAIYRHKDVFMAISFIIALITLLAYGNWFFKFLMLSKKFWSNKLSMRETYELFIFVLINCYIGSYAIMLIVPRYTLPVVPLFLVMIAVWFDRMFKKYEITA